MRSCVDNPVPAPGPAVLPTRQGSDRGRHTASNSNESTAAPQSLQTTRGRRPGRGRRGLAAASARDSGHRTRLRERHRCTRPPAPDLRTGSPVGLVRRLLPEGPQALRTAPPGCRSCPQLLVENVPIGSCCLPRRRGANGSKSPQLSDRLCQRVAAEKRHGLRSLRRESSLARRGSPLLPRLVLGVCSRGRDDRNESASWNLDASSRRIGNPFDPLSRQTARRRVAAGPHLR